MSISRSSQWQSLIVFSFVNRYFLASSYVSNLDIVLHMVNKMQKPWILIIYSEDCSLRWQLIWLNSHCKLLLLCSWWQLSLQFSSSTWLLYWESFLCINAASQVWGRIHTQNLGLGHRFFPCHYVSIFSSCHCPKLYPVVHMLP